ncbi:MAG: universal stress protein [Gammaproteobacteria bacterium]|nr:universal stress protein [Gammaproteobacteria bacterium]
MFSSIVVAIDGSPHAIRALAVGAELAARENATLGIIYVVDSNISGLPKGLFELSRAEHIIDPSPNLFVNLEGTQAEVFKAAGEASRESQRLITQLAEHIIKDAERNAKIDGAERITTAIRNGNPVEEIIIFAEQQNADVIVTGRRGLGTLKGLVMGSTSMKVTQAADCTCITVK